MFYVVIAVVRDPNFISCSEGSNGNVKNYIFSQPWLSCLFVKGTCIQT
jgi:hypothetical protein